MTTRLAPKPPMPTADCSTTSIQKCVRRYSPASSSEGPPGQSEAEAAEEDETEDEAKSGPAEAEADRTDSMPVAFSIAGWKKQALSNYLLLNYLAVLPDGLEQSLV